MCYVIVHVLDRNDNAPQFIYLEYKGFISEAAPVGSLVLTADSLPLALKAHDEDFELNALLQYEIIEATAKRIFYVVANTGILSFDLKFLIRRALFQKNMSQMGEKIETEKPIKLERMVILRIYQYPLHIGGTLFMNRNLLKMLSVLAFYLHFIYI